MAIRESNDLRIDFILLSSFTTFEKRFGPGNFREGVTPVPIPNTVVKLLIADSTAV